MWSVADFCILNSVYHFTVDVAPAAAQGLEEERGGEQEEGEQHLGRGHDECY